MLFRSAGRGKAIYEGKGGCANCHRVGTEGSRTGPSLSDIGSQRRAVELEQSLVNPDAEVLPQNRYYRVTTKAGETVTGRLLNIDTFTLQLIDAKGTLRSFQKADLQSSAFVEKSPMPSYKDKLSQQELADLVAYLVSLKGI